MQLAECLHNTPRRTLLAICQANGWPCDHRAPKTALQTLLGQRLQQRYRSIDAALLPPDQSQALAALAQRPDPMPLTQFQAHFGPIRLHRPWRKEEPRHPWRTPLSGAEDLYYRGLVFVIPPAAGLPLSVILPAELRARFQQPQGPPLDQQPGHANACVLLDMTLFLAYLQQVDLQPVHGRWLAPQHCQRLGACLAPPLNSAGLRSERHLPRLAFAHYLAERLNLLVVAGGLLKPSPAAAGWLAQDEPALLHSLWRAWLAPDEANRELWRRFHLPGHSLRRPADFTRRLIRHLAQDVPGDLATRLIVADLLPWWEHELAPDSLQTLVTETLAGPLAWLGVVQPVADAAPSPTPHLTPLGAWLAGRSEIAPAVAAPTPLPADEEMAIDLAQAAQPSRLAVFSLSAWSELTPGPCLRVTPASLARALAQGADLPNLFLLWQRFVAPPLSQEQQGQLRAWADSLRWVDLLPALLLHSPSAAIMDALWANRAVRPHLGQRLAPDLASVSSPDPDRLARALQSLDLILPARRLPVQPASARQDQQISLSPDDCWWLVAAGLVHRLVASRLGLPAPPSAALAVAQQALDPAQQAAAQAVAEAVDRALEHAIDGPPDPPAALPLEQIEQHLLAALEAGDALQLRYWSPWRAETTQRRVLPLALQWRGDHRYLIAHCLSVNAERTFRLDRILDLSSAPPPAP